MKKTYSPKERVLTAFAHQQPDRVPIDYLSNTNIDQRLKQYFGLNPRDDEGLLQALNVDFRYRNVVAMYAAALEYGRY